MSCATWDTLCSDMKELVLGKLSFHDLARAATICKELRGAYLSRAAEERANLVAVAQMTFGKHLFDIFVSALQRGLCGLRPCGSLRSKGWHVFAEAEKCTYITNQGAIKYASKGDLYEGLRSDGRFGLISAENHTDFSGRLFCEYPERFSGVSLDVSSASVSWNVYKFGRQNVC
jgi:hypothetical protein